MSLRLYNTLTKREEEFVPLDPAGQKITFYSCGPTVYDYAHIGNFRSFCNADVLRRTLELLGYEVRHVMNITDVGHMTDDDIADGSGEDKMELAAKRLLEAKKSGKLPPDAGDIDPRDPYQIAEFYSRAFLEDATKLGLKIAAEVKQHPEMMPRATKHVANMIEMIKTLVAKGHAYVASDGAVYFDVQSFGDYGKLSGNTPESIRAGEGGRVRETTQAVKKHPADFMLWKPDPSHLMRWPSPWGEGYPGWHIECSVMANALLGEQIDLHSGGEDNIFPHHECEIAQSRCASGKPHFARYWFHTRFLIVEGEKMSKSKGNFFTVRDLIAKGATPAAIRLELIKTHYRSNANFTFQGLQDSQRMIERWARLREWLAANRAKPRAAFSPLVKGLEAFKAALCGDVNVAGAIAALNEAMSGYDLSADAPSPPTPLPKGEGSYEEDLAALDAMNSVLGVLDLEREAKAEVGEDEAKVIEGKIAERNAARAAKDWAKSDSVRDELAAMGIVIKDGPEGTTWTRAVR